MTKEELKNKAQVYLRASGNEACLIAEDGTLFLMGSQTYARNHAISLKRKGMNGELLEVKASKVESKKDETPKEDNSPKENTPKPSSKRKTKKTRGK